MKTTLKQRKKSPIFTYQKYQSNNSEDVTNVANSQILLKKKTICITSYNLTTTVLI